MTEKKDGQTDPNDECSSNKQHKIVIDHEVQETWKKVCCRSYWTLIQSIIE